MEDVDIFWSAMIIAGAILGLFFRPKVFGIIVFSILVLSMVGSMGASYLRLIKDELFVLVWVVAIPAAIIIFGAALLSNFLRNVLKH